MGLVIARAMEGKALSNSETAGLLSKGKKPISLSEFFIWAKDFDGMFRTGTFISYAQPGQSILQANYRDNGRYIVSYDPLAKERVRFQVPLRAMEEHGNPMQIRPSDANIIIAVELESHNGGKPTIQYGYDMHRKETLVVASEDACIHCISLRGMGRENIFNVWYGRVGQIKLTPHNWNGFAAAARFPGSHWNSDAPGFFANALPSKLLPVLAWEEAPPMAEAAMGK